MGIGGKVRDIDLGYARIREDLKHLQGSRVLVGVQENTSRNASKAGGITDMVTVAVVNEFGSDDGKTPERSYMRSTYDDNREMLAGVAKAEFGAILHGRSTPERSLKLMGLLHVGQIQEKIHAGIAPANAPATIKKKGSSKPLIDTAQLVQSIRHVVKLGGGGSLGPPKRRGK